MRAGRFKYSLISREEFAQIKLAVNDDIRSAYKELRSGRVSPPEFVAHYLLAILKAWRPRGWRGAPRALRNDVQRDHQSNSLKFEGSASRAAALNVFHQFNLRSIPEGVNQALSGWADGRYQLDLLFHKPTAREVLLRQTTGRRVVTVFVDESGLQKIFDGDRDPFSFTLHDLVHAHKFFEDPIEHQAQVQFFNRVEKWLQLEEVSSCLTSSCEFSKAIDYVASDMNSHPAHLNQYVAHLAKSHGLTWVFNPTNFDIDRVSSGFGVVLK